MNTEKRKRTKTISIATVALVSFLLAVCMTATPAMAYYNFDGWPVVTRTSGTVDGGVFSDSAGWTGKTTLTGNFNVPSGTVKWARLYTGVWCGNPGAKGWVNVTFNGDSSSNGLGPIYIAGEADTNPNVWCTGYGKSYWWYDVTNLVNMGSVNTATTSEINGSLDGRVYGIALVVVYEGGDNPKHIQYWVNDGSDGLNYQTPHNTGTTDFAGTVAGSVIDANLAMVHLTAYSPICSNCLKFNDNLLDTSCVSTNAFDMHTWDVTNYVEASANDAWFSRGDDPYANVCNAILTVEMEVADTTPPYTDGHDPAKGATDVTPDTNIVVHVKDDGKGVDQNTIVMTVGGITVTPTTITGTPADYTLTYDPPTDFDYGQVVGVTIDAADLNATPNVMTTDSYSFTIKELKPSTSFFISGWVNNSIGDSVNNPLVTITNLNRPEIEPFIAENDTSSNYYQVLTSSEKVSAGDVLQFYARDSYGNVFKESHTVTEGEMNAGGFEQNITILYPYIDLVVTDINAYHNDTRCMPWFNLSNEVDVTVENVGTLPAGPFYVSLSINDGNFSEKKSVAGLEAGASTTVQFKWTPRGEDCFINCTYTDTCKYYNFTGVVDCDNAVTELDETNNEKTVEERACYNGYTGDDHLENVAHDTLRGGLLFTTGDGMYGGLYSVGSKKSTTYEITIPDGASVELAKLNVFYTWYYEREHCPQMKVSIANEGTTLCANIPMETRYNDLKCTEPEAAWIFPWGNYVFDLKDYVKGSGNYTVTVERTGGKSFAIAAPGIVLVYEDRNAPKIEYWINEGADILLGGRRYPTSSNLAWWECINNATFQASTETGNVTNATLGVVTPWGDDAPDDILFFNDVELGRGVYHGYSNPYSKTIDSITMEIGAGNSQVGVNVTNVTALYLNDSVNMVSQADDGDNMMPCKAFLVVEYEPKEVTANVTIKPETLNLNSKGVFTAFISNLSEHNLTDINVSTIVCEGAPAVDGTVADDNKYVVKFNTQNLTNVSEGDAVTMTVTGKLFDGTEFVGNDTIRVIVRPCLDDKSTTEELAVNPSTVNTMELTLLWKNNIKAAYGSVAINDKTNTGFVGSTDGKMYALNLNTGDIVWSHYVGRTIRSTPAIADGRVVFIADDGKVYALDQTDGSEIWTFTMRSGVQRSHFWSPAIHCDEVYAAANGMFYALDLETGAENWNYKFWPHSPYMVGAMTYSSPAVDPENNLVVFGKRCGVIALDITNGTPVSVWSRGIDVRYGSPTISHDLVFIGDYARDVVYALNETTGATVWSKSGIWADMPVTTAEINGNPVAFFTKGYRYPRKIYAVNALTGDELWPPHQVSTYMLFSGPAVAKIDDTYVLFAGGGYNRKLYALNAETGALLSEYATPGGRVYSSPAVTEIGGEPTVIFASTDGNVYAVQTTGNLGKEQEHYVGPWPKFHKDNRNTGYTCIVPEIPAGVRIEPEVLNLNSSGVFTAFVTLPPEHDVREIDMDTVYCEDAHVLRDTVAAVNNGTLIAKFDRKDLRADLPTGEEVEMTVTGALTDGTPFKGSDTICVIKEGQ